MWIYGGGGDKKNKPYTTVQYHNNKDRPENTIALKLGSTPKTDSSCTMDSINRRTGLMTLPSAFDTRGGSEQASDGCGGKGEVGRKSTAVVGSSGAGEADTGEGGGLSKRGGISKED